QNYPPNDGAVQDTRVGYSSMDSFVRDYGDHLDRLGKVDGDYLAVMPDGAPAPFEDRSLPIYNLTQPYHQYVLSGSLPDGWTLEISEVAPAFGREGGGLQVLIMDSEGEKVTIAGLKEAGIIK
ncbi:MAG: TNT domain-containing protein, partial [Mycobacterium sp.]